MSLGKSNAGPRGSGVQEGAKPAAARWDGVERRKSPPEVRLRRETVDYIERRMAEAVRIGITTAMNESNAEAFWAAGLSVLQKRANERTGRFVIGSLWGLTRRAGTFLLLGGVVYAVGGWQALAGLAKLLIGKG